MVVVLVVVVVVVGRGSIFIHFFFCSFPSPPNPSPGPLTEGENMQYDNSNQAYNTSNYSGYAAAPAGGAADNSLNDMVLRIIQAHHAEPQGVHINTILSDLERQGCPTSYQDTKYVFLSLCFG